MRALEEKLRAQNCVLLPPVHQHDTVYSRHGSAEFASAKEGDVILRIRRENDKAEFNLKQQKSNEMDNIEYETEIASPDALHGILGALGWFPEIEVKKIRRKGTLGAYNVCLDEVEQLGNYMEIEKMAQEDADPDAVRKELYNALEGLGFSRSDEETRGYDTQVHQRH